MASIGPIYATVGANSPGIGTYDWTQPDLAIAGGDDGTYASVQFTGLGATHYLVCTDPDFSSIPNNAIIEGLVVEFEKFTADISGGIVRDNSVVLWLNGGPIGLDHAASSVTWPPLPDIPTSHGGPADTWGITLTRGILTSPGFGVAISAQDVNGLGVICSVDYARFTVYFHNPPHIYVGSGGIVFGGSASVSVTRAATGSGILQFGGFADTSVERPNVYTGSGRIMFGGAATLRVTYRSFPAVADDGVFVTNITFGGSATYSVTNVGARPYRPLGFSPGPYLWELFAAPQPTGGIVFGGSAFYAFIPLGALVPSPSEVWAQPSNPLSFDPQRAINEDEESLVLELL